MNCLFTTHHSSKLVLFKIGENPLGALQPLLYHVVHENVKIMRRWSWPFQLQVENEIHYNFFVNVLLYVRVCVFFFPFSNWYNFSVLESSLVIMHAPSLSRMIMYERVTWRIVVFNQGIEIFHAIQCLVLIIGSGSVDYSGSCQTRNACCGLLCLFLV